MVTRLLRFLLVHPRLGSALLGAVALVWGIFAVSNWRELRAYSSDPPALSATEALSADAPKQFVRIDDPHWLCASAVSNGDVKWPHTLIPFTDGSADRMGVAEFED